MIIATVAHNSFVYRIVLLAHVLTAIVGFGSSFVWPMLAAKARKLDSPNGTELMRAGAQMSRPLTAYMVFAVLISGLALSGVGAGWEFSQTWVWLSFVLTTAVAVITAFFQTPNLDAMIDIREQLDGGDDPLLVEELAERRKRDAMYGGINHTLFLVILVLMIWKPGV